MLSILLFFSTVSLYGDEGKKQLLRVTIDYGQLHPTRTVMTTYRSGDTALEVLRQVAMVGIKKAGKYTFITAIDGIVSKPKETGWFYTLDGERADKTASAKRLHNAQEMQWAFRPDHCLAPGDQ